MVIKSVNEETREFEGIASTPTPDRVNDVIDPQGLTYQKETPLLMNHKADQPVGTVNFGKATPKGLPFKGKIPTVDEPGAVKDRTDEAWHSIKHGLVKGVSIGFRPKEYNHKDDGGVHFSKADVHELSLTAVPCNPQAMITAFKSLEAYEATQVAESGETPVVVADPSQDAASTTEVKTAPRAALKPFFYPSY